MKENVSVSTVPFIAGSFLNTVGIKLDALIDRPGKMFKSGKQTVERKLCPHEDSCGAEGFCITATSGDQQWPCNRDYTGTSLFIHHNGNLIALDHKLSHEFLNN